MHWAKEIVDQICLYFIKPGRQRYVLEEHSYQLPDGTVRQTGELLGLVYTYIQPPNHTTTVVYLHCNNSCQREGLYLQQYLRPLGIALFLFDFEGCGNSPGEYITLGLLEAEQVRKVVDQIQRRNRNKIVLWGRSMGATTLLRYLQQYGSDNIVCGVVDSAYKSLRMLVSDMLPFLPNFLLQIIYDCVCRINAEKIGHDISDLEVFSKMRSITCPLMFLASRIDGMVPFGHTYDLFRFKSGDKQLVEITADHNDRRSINVTLRCIAFIQHKIETLQSDDRRPRIATEQLLPIPYL